MNNINLNRYLWTGLDFNRYSVAEIIPQDRYNAVIIMKSNDKTNPHWCLQYRGGGHYFDTVQQLLNYYNKREFKNSPTFMV